MSKKVVCDRCGKVLPSGYMAKSEIDWVNGVYPIRVPPEIHIDLCSSCSIEVWDAMRQMLTHWEG